MIFAFQFLKWYFDNIDEIAIDVFVHVGVNTEVGILPVQFSKGAEQVVPNAQYIAIVAIGVRQLAVMVNMVQVRCNENKPQYFIGTVRQPELGVGYNIGKCLEYLPDDEHPNNRS